jgi:serine-type D-Ala-D-Ala carboxypeptidase
LRHGSCLYPEFGLCYNPDIKQRTLVNRDAHTASPLRTAYDEQDERFGAAFELLHQAVHSHSFPAACLAVTVRDTVVALKPIGRFTYEPGAPQTAVGSIFDLASVSKVVATTAAAMVLYERGLLDLEMPVAAVIPEFLTGDARRSEITIHMLLSHSSGLPAYEKVFLKAESRDELLRAAFAMPLANDPGSKAEYSDIGFIVLGAALERLADEALDRLCQREVFGPLGMIRTTFNPPSGWRESIPPTADDQTFRHRIIQGEVQDENASVLGGVAGHAGVFSTAMDVASFAHAMLQGDRRLAQPETVVRFTRRESSPAGTSRALGWDTPSAPSQSGKHFSAGSFGHLGYTGCSLWIDPERQLSVTLLTNRTWPDCQNQRIKEVRPAVHDAILEALS